MIKALNSKNLLGVTILGDYEDLSTLREAISNYSNLYMCSQEDPEAAHCYECVLGLCYDLRHAFQGDRGFEAAPSNAENLSRSFTSSPIFTFGGEGMKNRSNLAIAAGFIVINANLSGSILSGHL